MFYLQRKRKDEKKDEKKAKQKDVLKKKEKMPIS